MSENLWWKVVHEKMKNERVLFLLPNSRACFEFRIPERNSELHLETRRRNSVVRTYQHATAKPQRKISFSIKGNDWKNDDHDLLKSGGMVSQQRWFNSCYCTVPDPMRSSHAVRLYLRLSIETGTTQLNWGQTATATATAAANSTLWSFVSFVSSFIILDCHCSIHYFIWQERTRICRSNPLLRCSLLVVPFRPREDCSWHWLGWRRVLANDPWRNHTGVIICINGMWQSRKWKFQSDNCFSKGLFFGRGLKPTTFFASKALSNFEII